MFEAVKAGEAPRRAALTASNMHFRLETELWARHSLHQSSSQTEKPVARILA
jgi:hypothetical protein